MPNFFRLPLFTALALIGTVHADEQDSHVWLDTMRASCAQQYGAEQCRDDEFLNEHFHTNDLQTAHRAAIRHRAMEQRALRELLLQRTCGDVATYCSNSETPDCATQLQQMCSAIQQQAAACTDQATQYCAAATQTPNCLAQRQAQCPSAKKQSIDQLLAKYPKLSLPEQLHVRQVAQQIDANQRGWIGDLFSWLGFST